MGQPAVAPWGLVGSSARVQVPALDAAVAGNAALVAAPSAVQLSHQVPVPGACVGEFLAALGEFGAEVEDPLLQLADPVGECFDVGGGTESGGFPDGLSECFGQALFDPGGVCGETAVTGREVRDAGQQRLAADLGPGGSAGRRFGPAPVERTAPLVEEKAPQLCPSSSRQGSAHPKETRLRRVNGVLRHLHADGGPITPSIAATAAVKSGRAATP